MTQNQILKQMVNFNKAIFENTYNAIVQSYDQSEKIANTFLGQNNEMREKGQSIFSEWSEIFKNGRNDFKKAVDESFKNTENMFN